MTAASKLLAAPAVAAGGGLTDPTDITGCIGWWDASDATQFTYWSGVLVKTWDDKSGSGNHLSTSGSSIAPSRTGTQNGLTVVNFPSARYLSVPTLGPSAATIFVVIKTANDSGNFGLWRFGSVADGTYFPFSGTIYDGFASTTRKIVGNSSTPLNQWNVYSVLSKSGEWTARINNTQEYTTGSNTVGWSSSQEIGRNYGAAASLTGDIAEIVIYDNDISDDDRDDLVTWFDDKWDTAA